MTKIIADQPADITSDAPGAEFLPLRGLANILTVLLAVVVAFIWARLAIQPLSPGSAHYFTDFQLDNAADITILPPALSAARIVFAVVVSPVACAVASCCTRVCGDPINVIVEGCAVNPSML